MYSKSKRISRVVRYVLAILLVVACVTPAVILSVFGFVASNEETLASWWAFRKGARYVGRQGIIFQKKSNDCGAAALLMILTYHHVQVFSQEVYSNMTFESKGASMMQLKSVAERYGLHPTGQRLRPVALEDLQMSAILLMDGDHFVVLSQVLPAGDVEVLDPALGRLIYSRMAFRRHWNGHALVFQSQQTLALGKEDITNKRSVYDPARKEEIP